MKTRPAAALPTVTVCTAGAAEPPVELGAAELAEVEVGVLVDDEAGGADPAARAAC